MLIALCDDNWGQLKILESAASDCDIWRDMELTVNTFTSGADLLEAVRSGNIYDYIFLDIQMPGLSGFDVFAEFAKSDKSGGSAIVFVSSHLDLLPDVFALRAYGFLPKPFDQDAFDRTVKSVVEQRIETQFFAFSQSGVRKTISCKGILYFQMKNYTITIHTAKGDQIILHRKSLNQTEQELSQYGFFRCNRSTLVNLLYCSGREQNQLFIGHNGTKIAISRQKLKEFDRRLIHYKMGDKDAFRAN